MSGDRKTRRFSIEGLREERRQRHSASYQYDTLASGVTVRGGSLNTPMQNKIVNYDRAMNETIIDNGLQGNAFIVLGGDRPHGVGSGEGGAGTSIHSKGNNRIELTVGLGSRANDGHGPEDDAIVSPHPHADAAKLYLSDTTRADENFGFCGDVRTFQSTITGLADTVNFFGINGIKFATGQPHNARFGSEGVGTAHGADVEAAPKIILAAGNHCGVYEMNRNVNVLQPITKGENMIACVEELSQILDLLIGALERQAMIDNICFSALGIAIPPASAAVAGRSYESWASYITSMGQLRTNLATWQTNYCTIGGALCIASPNVFSS